jgi:HSP20 family protein
MYPGLFSRDMLYEMDQLQREVQRAFETVTPSIRGRALGYPALNIGNTPSSVEIYAFAPGMDPAKLQLDLDRLVLTIAGERAANTGNGEQATAHISERFEGRFRRVVSLPDDINPDAISAEYRDGVLHVSIQRRASSLPRKITVQ